MKKIEKGAEGEISPSTISNLLSKKLNHDIITYEIVPFLFSTCRKCSTLVMEEQLRKRRCPDCLISVCFHYTCNFRGTERDFHVYANEWYCEQESWDYHADDRKFRDKHLVDGLCRCKMILGCPKKLAAVQKRAKLHREKEEKKLRKTERNGEK